MKIIRNTLPISEIYQKMTDGSLKINRNYQRSQGLWPKNARTYFIDSILNEFPFPKVILRDIIDLKTKKSTREIIDGQQRLTSIRDFIDNKLKLTSVSKNYGFKIYEDLDEEDRKTFLSYEVSTDIVISASEEEVLEIFKRINSYTLPLNNAEKRYATYQGAFKWFINDIAEMFRPFFEKYKILSIREMSRMEDADLITEFCQIKIEGIQERSSKKLDIIYKKYDENFPNKDQINEVIIRTFDFITSNFLELFDAYVVPSYIFYSLIGALIFNKYEIPDPKKDLIEFNPINEFCINVDSSKEELHLLLSEVESKNEHGKFPNFIKASLATTQSYKNRLTRIRQLIDILRVE
jgi:hypothetical protein